MDSFAFAFFRPNHNLSGLNHSPNLSLEEIIGSCTRGERSAQRQLYHDFYSYGLTVSLHYAPNRQSAEEIVHDAFLKVFENIHQLEKAERFRFWFRQIVVRTAIDYFRRSGKTAANAGPDTAALEGRIENEAELKLEKEDVIRILQQLPDQYRLVFNMFVLEEYSHCEIANILGISVGTSKSNLSRAKVKLRQLLKPTGKLM